MNEEKERMVQVSTKIEEQLVERIKEDYSSMSGFLRECIYYYMMNGPYFYRGWLSLEEVAEMNYKIADQLAGNWRMAKEQLEAVKDGTLPPFYLWKENNTKKKVVKWLKEKNPDYKTGKERYEEEQAKRRSNR